MSCAAQVNGLIGILVFQCLTIAALVLALIFSGRTVEVSTPHWFPKRRGDNSTMRAK